MKKLEIVKTKYKEKPLKTKSLEVILKRSSLVFYQVQKNKYIRFSELDFLFRNELTDYFAKYSFIALAAFRPSPIARITVAAPRTISPPAQTFALLVSCFSSTEMCPFES